MIAKIVGVLRKANTTKISFTNVSSNTALVPNSTYRLIADQDFYISIEDQSTDTVDNTGVLMKAGVEMFVQTNGTFYFAAVIRAGADSGNLYLTRVM